MINFQEYRDAFEREIIIAGHEAGMLGKLETVTTRQNRLITTSFGHLMGSELDYDGLLVLDYYGLLKASRAWYRASQEQRQNGQRFIKAPVIHFPSVKLEYLAKLAPHLIVEFSDFKQAVLEARGFL